MDTAKKATKKWKNRTLKTTQAEKGEKMLENPEKSTGHLHSIVKKFYFTYNWISRSRAKKHGAEATPENASLLNSHSLDYTDFCHLVLQAGNLWSSASKFKPPLMPPA